MRCCKPIIEVFEYKLQDDIFIPSNLDLKLPITPETDIELLKDKVICEYLKIISELELGRKPDIEFLLEEISAIELENELNNREFVILYYLDNYFI